MSVYVDIMRPCLKNMTWSHNESCHLVADSIEELHEFAKQLGLKRSWFQNRPWLPHYDLTQNKRRLAVKKGAIEITTSELVSMMKGNQINDKA